VTREPDFFVDRERQREHQRGLADEQEVVGAGKILAQQPQLAQAIGGHEVGVINDGDQHFAGAMDAEGVLHEQPGPDAPGRRISPRRTTP
jgi:hypothetical protein